MNSAPDSYGPPVAAPVATPDSYGPPVAVPVSIPVYVADSFSAPVAPDSYGAPVPVPAAPDQIASESYGSPQPASNSYDAVPVVDAVPATIIAQAPDGSPYSAPAAPEPAPVAPEPVSYDAPVVPEVNPRIEPDSYAAPVVTEAPLAESYDAPETTLAPAPAPEETSYDNPETVNDQLTQFLEDYESTEAPLPSYGSPQASVSVTSAPEPVPDTYSETEAPTEAPEIISDYISEYEYEDEYDPNDIPIDQRAPETEAPEAAPVTESYVAPAPEPTQPKYDGRVIIVKAIPSSSASSSYKTYKPVSISGGPVAPASNPYAAFSWKDPVGDHSYNNDEVGVVLPAVIPIDSVRGSASSYAGGPVPDLELSESSENLALAERDLDLRTVFNPNDLTGYNNDLTGYSNDNSEYSDEYEYYDDEYEYYYEEDDDIMPEMIDLRGSQPLVVDNYASRRR